MAKADALALFGGVKETAAAMRISRQGVSKWPDWLSNRIADRVRGAHQRLKARRRRQARVPAAEATGV